MPQRNERFFWLHTKQISADLALEIGRTNQEFTGKWNGCDITCVSCVQTKEISDRLWLFRLATVDQKLARKFKKEIEAHIKNLSVSFSVRAKRQASLPQPLICPRLDTWPDKTDIGLHSVNDQYNGMLITYSYYGDRYYHPPHLQLSQLLALYSRVRDVWQQVICSCHHKISTCLCGNIGCYECVQVDCKQCCGTGWKDFEKWVQGGYRIDYATGFPQAIF